MGHNNKQFLEVQTNTGLPLKKQEKPQRNNLTYCVNKLEKEESDNSEFNIEDWRWLSGNY